MRIYCIERIEVYPFAILTLLLCCLADVASAREYHFRGLTIADGLARLAYISKNQELTTKVKGVIDAIIENQQKDGFFFTPSKRDSFHKVDLEQGLEAHASRSSATR